MTYKLTKALKEQKKKNVQTQVRILGSLGIPLGGQRLVEVPDRPSFVYVQLRDNQNEVVQAYNNQVAPSYGLPVIVQRESNRYIVIGVDTIRYQSLWQNSAPFLPRHGPTHSFDPDAGGGGDMVWVFSRQFMPLLVYPSGTQGSSTVLISPHILQSISGSWMYVGNTGVGNLSQYHTTGSGQIMALIYMNRLTGNPGVIVNSGAYFSNLFTTAAQVTPYIPSLTSPAIQIPLGAVRLTTGSNHINWSYIYDVRQFVQAQVTGTAGGSGGGGTDTIGFAGLYQGVPIGTGTFLNVRGQNVTFTKSGSMFDLFMTGSNPAPSVPALPIYKNGSFIVSGTLLDFEGNVNVGATGTNAYLNFPTTTYFRVGQPAALSYATGLYWRVPDGVYASGSLGIFVNGHALIPGIDYIEQWYISGLYQYTEAQMTGTYHLAHYGVPCVPQTQGSSITDNYLTDSNGDLLTDSNGNQLTDSNG